MKDFPELQGTTRLGDRLPVASIHREGNQLIVGFDVASDDDIAKFIHREGNRLIIKIDVPKELAEAFKAAMPRPAQSTVAPTDDPFSTEGVVLTVPPKRTKRPARPKENASLTN